MYGLFNMPILMDKMIPQLHLDAKNYKSKSFIHYSITNNEVVEQEPAERWQFCLQDISTTIFRIM